MAASVLQDAGWLSGTNFAQATGANQVTFVTEDGTQMLVFDGTAKTITVQSGVTLQ